MIPNGNGKKTIVIPCSGIGKVQGLIAREAAYAAASAGDGELLCLALLVSGDEEAVSRIRDAECITIDGCPKLCAVKNVEATGGTVAKSIQVIDVLKNHRGAELGTATKLADAGWAVAHEIAQDINHCESEVK